MRNLFPGLLAGFVNIIFIPLILVVSHKYGWFDKVESRKIHTGKIPRLGGIGIFWSFIVTVAISALFFRMDGDGARTLALYWPIGVSVVFVHLLGLVDDFLNLRALFRFAFQIGVSALVASQGFVFESIWLPGLGDVALGWLSFPLTVVWIVGIINALNFIDGIDGLSGGIAIIAVFSFGIIFAEDGHSFPWLVSVALAGSIAGFLFYNFPPAKIFMGDSGSTFLGFSLAVIPLLAKGKASGGLWIWDAITILLVPIFDTFAAIIRRTRAGRSPMSPDRFHIHHKLINLGFTVREILAILYALCMGFGAIGVSVLFLPPLAHWILIIVSWAVAIVLFTVMHFWKERGTVLFGRNAR